MSTAQSAQDRQVTRRTYLQALSVLCGADAVMAREVTASIAVEHPEWDLDGETDTFAGWERRAVAAHERRLAAAGGAA